MKAVAMPLRFICDEPKLEIPFFQRAYVWKFENAKGLLDDLLKSEGNHFIGSILLKRTTNNVSEEDSTPNRSIVIDGQQRLTTLSILIKVMYEYFEENDLLESSIETDAREALFYKSNGKDLVHLINSYVNRESFKQIIGEVKTTKIQRHEFFEITSPMKKQIEEEIAVEKDWPEEKIEEKYNDNEDKIRECYKYFKKRIYAEEKEKLLSLWNKLFSKDQKDAILVLISIEEGEQEQEIFDTINSAGMHLSSTDIIKNNLYDKLKSFGESETEVYKYYVKTWQRTFEDENVISFWSRERNIGRSKRDNTEILFQAIGIIRGIYEIRGDTLSDMAKKYKDWVDLNIKSEEELKNFINEIMDYAKIYQSDLPSFSPSWPYKFDNVKERLSCVMEVSNNTTFTPYILFLYKTYTDEERLNEKLNIVDRILMHHIITGASTGNFNKTCYDIIQNELKGQDKVDQYIKEDVDDFDEESIRLGLKKKKNNTLAKLILFWVEAYKRKQNKTTDKTAIPLMFTEELTLEHILPQTFETEKWNSVPVMSEENTEIIDIEEKKKYRKQKVYSLGNMTILTQSQNSVSSNEDYYTKVNGRPAQGKKKALEGFRENSYFLISEDLIPPKDTNKEDYLWNEYKITEREKKLGDLILEIWPVGK